MMHSLLQLESGTVATSASRESAPTLPHFYEVPARPAKAVSRTYAAVPLKNNDDAELVRPASTRAFDASDLERSRPVTPTGMDDVDMDVERDEHGQNNVLSGTVTGEPHTASNEPQLGLGAGAGADDHPEGIEVEALQSLWHPYKNRFRLLSISLLTLANGLNDSAAGALLPYIERHYGIGYGIVSLIFVGCAFGSIAAATVIDPIKCRLGHARTLVLSQLLVALGYVPMLTMAAPFVAVVMGFFVVGFGLALNLALGNTFCGSLREASFALGIMHGLYGVGGISGPLIATAVVVKGNRQSPQGDSSAAFGRYYFLPMGIIILAAVVSAWSFADYEHESEATAGSSSSIISAHPSRAAGANPSPNQQEPQQTGIELQQLQGAALEDVVPRPPLSTVTSSRVPSPEPGVSLRPSLAPLQPVTGVSMPMPSFSSTAPLVAPATTVSALSGVESPVSRSPPPQQGTVSALSRAPSAAGTAPTTHIGRTRGSSGLPSFLNLGDMFSARGGRVVLLGALFLFAYQGAEVSIAGWVTSFLIANRGGREPTAGYVTAGFWAGITLGRFALAVPAQRVGERRFVFGCVAGAAAFELLVWFVPNEVGDAVAVSIVGLLLGPIYPCAAVVLLRGLGRRERVTGFGVMAAFGSAGGAAAPFLTGVLAQAAGPFVLHPIAIALCAFMVFFWFRLPVTPKRRE